MLDLHSARMNPWVSAGHLNCICNSRLQNHLPILKPTYARNIGLVAATLPLCFGLTKTQMNTDGANGECADTHSPVGQSASVHTVERKHVEA